jgi:hypothetical protein
MNREMLDMTAVLDRLHRVEAVLEIHNLKSRYCAGCDDNHNADTLEAIFVPEGRWKCDAMNVDAKGHAERRVFFDGLANSGRIRNSQHMVTNPNVVVDGDRATGYWRMMMVYAGNAPDGTVQFHRILGHYQDDFVFCDGRWLFETIRPMVEDTEAYTVEPSKFR